MTAAGSVRSPVAPGDTPPSSFRPPRPSPRRQATLPGVLLRHRGPGNGRAYDGWRWSPGRAHNVTPLQRRASITASETSYSRTARWSYLCPVATRLLLGDLVRTARQFPARPDE